MSDQLKQILILSSAESDVNRSLNDEFVQAINQHVGDDINVSWAHYSDIGYHFRDGIITPFWVTDGRPLATYDFVYIKSYYRYTESALVLVEYFKQKNIPFVCSELQYAISFSKLSQYGRLSHAGLPIPETLFVPQSHLSHSYSSFATILGLPFIFKAIDAKGGGANYLINSTEEFSEAVASNHGHDFVAQKFIANDSDLRILVLGGKVEMVIKRQRVDDSTHLNNTSQGGGATLVDPADLDPAHAKMAIDAAQLLQREIAGVDLMFETGTGRPFILEINASPQVASGAFTQEKIEKYGNFFKNMLQ